MKQQQFEAANAPTWRQYRVLLEQLEGGAKSDRRSAQLDPRGFPQLYRTICGHYALARTRAYSPGLIADLHDLARRGYPHLYRRRPRILRAALGFMAEEFPRTLRRHALVVWMGMALLFLPMLAMGVATYVDEEVIYSLMNGAQVSNLEEMYDPANRRPGRSHGRQADTDFAMFGFYIMNNVGIGFRSFASGLIFGVGSAVILSFNGLHIGAAAGHLTRLDYGGTFWTFVSGHGPYELTAIAISGAAGLLLGKALLAPGRRTRLAALRANARDAIVLVGGAALMLLLAAIVEAFWSSSPAPAPVKYGVGLAGWVLVAAYLGLAGRERHGA